MLRFRQSIRHVSSCMRVNPEVKHALEANMPIVALESTIITHGLPYPANIEMAKEVESIIRSRGCVPATMGYLNGECVVGLNNEDLEQIGDPNSAKMKVSRRDIATVLARKITGGTTIATTMDLCNRVGIDVFATGGLGGVSRPFELMDVSADLEELAQSPVGVVCSGPKSILDVGRTLEYLETKGVMVSTFIDDDMFEELIRSGAVNSKRQAMEMISKGETLGVSVPGFYLRDSGVKSPYVFENAAMAAHLLYTSKFKMGLPAGQVFCVPAPKEVELNPILINRVIEESLAEADRLNVRGKALTPFLLGRINSVTKGASVKCNVEFVKNNAKMGCEIAKNLSELKTGETSDFQPVVTEAQESSKLEEENENMLVQPTLGSLAVIGSVAVDVVCKTQSEMPYMEDSNPGAVTESIGGVGFNVALATQMKSSNPVVFISKINKNDSSGQFIVNQMKALGMYNKGLVDSSDNSTARYVSMHNGKGELIMACADMGIIETLQVDEVLPTLLQVQPRDVIIDANISVQLMSNLVRAMENQCNFIYEPTSVVKCGKIGQVPDLPVFPKSPFRLMTPTVNELQAMAERFKAEGKLDDIQGWFNVLDAIGVSSLRTKLDLLSHRDPLIKHYLNTGVFQIAFQLLPYFPCIVLKDGANGVTVFQINDQITAAQKERSQGSSWSLMTKPEAGRHDLGVTIEHFDAYPLSGQLKNVTGAGDALLGALVAATPHGLPTFGSSERFTAIQGGLRAAADRISE